MNELNEQIVNNNYVLVLGYGWSGSSAVVDYLKEFKGFIEPNVEFRLIKDPYGLMDLRYNLVERFDPLNADAAIKDFIWFVNQLNQKRSRVLLKSGLNYETSFHGKFMKSTKTFLDEILDFDYRSEWWFLDFKKTKLETLFYKIGKKLGRESVIPTMKYSNISADAFDKVAKKYIDSLFCSIENKNETNIILDQAVPAQFPEQAKHYFNNAKVIIVDRDPRDIYVDLIRGEFLIGRELSKTHEVNKYVKWHKGLRRYERSSLKSDVLYINFEDIVLEYDNTTARICDFLNLSETDHIKKFEFFNPKVSSKNIAIWKEYPNTGEIDIIRNELMECTNEKETSASSR